MTDDLITFLRTRLDEDEQTARLWPAKLPADGPPWRDTRGVIIIEAGRRLLAEAEAKRRIIEWCIAADDIIDAREVWEVDTEDVLQLLALPYAEHPDYLEDWRP